MLRIKLWRYLSALFLFILSFDSAADWIFNMTPGVTDVSQDVYGLHMIILTICIVIAVVVFGVMFYSMLKHRKSQGAVAHNFHENTLVEIVWTIIPFVILIGMAIPATKTLARIYEKAPSEVTVEIIGYQWKWRYRYLNDDPAKEITFFSNLSTPASQISNQAPKTENYLLEVDEPLVLPSNTRVRFLISANDVIHSWWVPELAVKKDAIPGIINEAWTKVNEEGVYRGQCAELCGQNHGFMPIVVDVRSPQAYQLWASGKQQQAADVAAAAGQDWTKETLIEKGEAVYNTFCAACHQANGEGIPNVFPALKDSAIAIGAIENHVNIVMKGVSGTAMQAFGQQLSDTDIAAVVTFERNSWGNDTGDMVSPQDVTNYKSGQ